MHNFGFLNKYHKSDQHPPPDQLAMDLDLMLTIVTTMVISGVDKGKKIQVYEDNCPEEIP